MTRSFFPDYAPGDRFVFISPSHTDKVRLAREMGILNAVEVRDLAAKLGPHEYARLTPMGGFLRAVDLQIMGSTPAPKMTPRQSRRARKRERRREKFAYRYDTPFNVIETFEVPE